MPAPIGRPDGNAIGEANGWSDILIWAVFRRNKKIVIPLLAAVIAVSAASFQLFDTTHTQAQSTTAPPPKESVVFYYQKIHPEDVDKFRGAQAVVTAGQGDVAGEREAVELIHQAGAKALRYVNFYWYPENEVYQDLNISNHKDWIFCGKDKRKIVGRKIDGQKWFFLDANERAALTKGIRPYLNKLKGYGYDGVFFDRGSASFLGSKDGGNYIAFKKSTCTKNKVIAGKQRTFSDVFLRVLKDTRNNVFNDQGDLIFMNFGGAPYVAPQLRPNPADGDCRARNWTRCSYKRDVWPWVDRVVDEAPSHAGFRYFRDDYEENLTSEDHFPRVIGEIKVPEYNKKKVYYQWAQARLFRITLFINTGDDQCPTSSGDVLCWRYGTWPELTRVSLGAPIDPSPVNQKCESDDADWIVVFFEAIQSYFQVTIDRPVWNTRCIWVRRYERGMVVVNVSSRPRVLTQPLGLGSPRLVKDLFSNSQVGACIDRISDRPIPAESGRVYLYETC